jgi:hypothetical protein
MPMRNELADFGAGGGFVITMALISPTVTSVEGTAQPAGGPSENPATRGKKSPIPLPGFRYGVVVAAAA